MPTKLKIRFQHWVIGMTALLVLGMSTGFLATVYRTFSSMGETAAQQQFALVSALASQKLETVIHQSGDQVKVRAGADRNNYIKDGHINSTSIVPTLLGSLVSDPNVYSHYFALENDEFLQVIAIRSDSRIQVALQAPEGTEFVVRRINRAANGNRIDSYQFFDMKRMLIGSRAQEAKLVPTQRPWYGGAIKKGGLYVADPYIFASTGELGLTVAAPLEGGGGVMATDISLRTLNNFLSKLNLPPNGAIAIQDASGNLLSFYGKGDTYKGAEVAPMTPAEKLTHPQMVLLKSKLESHPSDTFTMGKDSVRYVFTHDYVAVSKDTSYQITIWAPESDFTGAFTAALRDVFLFSVALLAVLLPLTFAGSRQIARTLTSMAQDSERLKRLDFSIEPQQGQSILYEVNALGEAQYVMHGAIQTKTQELQKSQAKLANLVDIGISLSREQNRQKLLSTILFGARDISYCAAATLFLKTEQNTLVFAQRTSDDPLPSFEIPLFDANGVGNNKFVVVNATNTNRTIIIDDVYAEKRFDMSGTKKFSEESGIKTISMLTVPLSPREGEVIGVIQLLNALDPETKQVVPFSPELIGFVEALAAQAAVAIENQNLIEAQKQLMDALIKLIAGAIDAKSPYTGGHCERVPELGIMLAEAATAQTDGPLASFKFETEDEWREFRVGAWLHDCGKVTTPEYVVDKAVKLETIYNRIHEVRMRFEVLLRDAQIAALESVASGADAIAAQTAFEARKAQLADDFAFVAECNVGGEFMAPDKIERLKKIAEETWMRNYDDRLGLAYEEIKRYVGDPEPLPVKEKLLADKAHHVIPRVKGGVVDPKWDFKVNVPKDLYNYGEVYNLSVARGTLTEEERFKINEHVMQSLMMLEQLPLPKNLRRVPEYAGTHHETLVGTGYPRKLTENDLSVPMRIMAIADIFEALTASDRPYKKAKTLSESIKILSFFKKDKHIDPALFDLFLTSGVYKRYAEKYLLPEQIDEVDVAKFVG
jgi:HD-GYP domain-containing protein (c-di-GMP phosphodiesterase class II)